MAEDTTIQPVNPEPLITINEDEGLGEIFDYFTNSEVTDLLQAINQEFFVPMKLSIFMILAFWSLFVHGSLAIFITLALIIFWVGTFRRKDIRSISNLRVLDMRLFQASIMYMNLMYVDILSFILMPLKYFGASDWETLRHQIMHFISTTSILFNIRFWTIVKISTQIYWSSLSCLVLSRTVANLFLMSTTPTFRVLLKYETQALFVPALSILFGITGFNYLANNLGNAMPIAVFLTITLFLWVLFCILNSTVFKEHLEMPRTNDLDGAMKILTATTCQTIIGGLLLLSLSILENVQTNSFSASRKMSEFNEENITVLVSPLKEISKYLKDVKQNNFQPDSENPVISWDWELIFCTGFLVTLTRTLNHMQYANRLNLLMERTFVNE